MAFNFLRFSLKYCCKMSFKVEISSIWKEKRIIFSRFTKAVNICYDKTSIYSYVQAKVPQLVWINHFN